MNSFNDVMNQYLNNKRQASPQNNSTTMTCVPANPPAPAPRGTAAAAPATAASSSMPSSGQTPSAGTTGSTSPIDAFNQPQAQTMINNEFLNSALTHFVGQLVQVEFLIGTNTLLDRTGTLLEVGANYIILNERDTDDLLICDFFSIKFVRVYL